MTTDTPEIIDALPYIDTTIDEDEKQRDNAMQEVEDEMIDFPPEKDYLEYLPPIERKFCTPFMEHQYNLIEHKEMVQNSGELAVMLTDIAPPMSSRVDGEELALQLKCLNQLKIKLEYRQRQMVNLELIKNYGAAAWDQYITEYESMNKTLEEELDSIARKTQETNWSRKSAQEQVGKTLDILKNEWNLLVDRNRLLLDEINRLSLAI